jgi:hypothetical protein
MPSPEATPTRPARVDPHDALERGRRRAAEYRSAAVRLARRPGSDRAVAARLKRADELRRHASELSALTRALEALLAFRSAEAGA